MKKFLLFALIMIIAGCSGSQNKAVVQKKVAPNPAKKFYQPAEYQKKLGKGIDVDWAKTKLGSQFYNQKTPVDFQKRGFSHVRIRVKDDLTPPVIQHLKKVINDSLAAGLIPVLAYQAKDFKENPSQENLEETVRWWTTAAENFAGFSPKLSFDLIIEVTDNLNKEPEILNNFYEKAVSEIRKTNPQRIIFISPVVRSAPENLEKLKIPSQAKGFLMVEWHFYASGPDKKKSQKEVDYGNRRRKKSYSR